MLKDKVRDPSTETGTSASTVSSNTSKIIGGIIIFVIIICVGYCAFGPEEPETIAPPTNIEIVQ